MKTLEEITASIEAAAPAAWEKSNGKNWHRLVLTAAGEVYWAEELGQSSMSVSVWEGTDCSLMHFQGQSWGGADEEAYEMIEASDEIKAELDAISDGHGEVSASDGHNYTRGRKSYGYNPAKWYRTGDLLSFRDACPDCSAAEYMHQAIEAAEEFWTAKA